MKNDLDANCGVMKMELIIYQISHVSISCMVSRSLIFYQLRHVLLFPSSVFT